MKELLSKANMNDAQLRSIVSKVVAKNLGSLSEPCFYPEIKKNFYDFLKATGLTEKDLKDFSKRRWQGKKESKFATNTNALANFYVFLLQYFLSKGDKQTYTYFMIFFIIRHYTSLMHKHFKFCNPDVFKYTFEVLTKTHLFARERSISNALYFMAQEMIRRWTLALKSNNLDDIGLFMREARHRVSQSVKSFAQTYYTISEEGTGLQTSELPSDEDENTYQTQSTEKYIRLIDDITKKITVYRFADRKAQEDARSFSKINSSLATQIISKLNDPKNSDLIRTILKLYFKDLTDVKQICGKDYETHVRQLMSLKRTKSKIYFKQQINILLLSLLKDFDYIQKYQSLTSQTQFLINLFLAYYMTMLVKHTVCISR